MAPEFRLDLIDINTNRNQEEIMSLLRSIDLFEEGKKKRI